LGVVNEVNNAEAIHLDRAGYSFQSLSTGDEAEEEAEADGRAEVSLLANVLVFIFHLKRARDTRKRHFSRSQKDNKII